MTKAEFDAFRAWVDNLRAEALDDALAAVERVADTGGPTPYMGDDLCDAAYREGWESAIAACADALADLT